MRSTNPSVGLLAPDMPAEDLGSVCAKGIRRSPWATCREDGALGPTTVRGCRPAAGTASRKENDSGPDCISHTPVFGFTRCSKGTFSGANAWNGRPQPRRRDGDVGRARHGRRHNLAVDATLTLLTGDSGSAGSTRAFVENQTPRAERVGAACGHPVDHGCGRRLGQRPSRIGTHRLRL